MNKKLLFPIVSMALNFWSANATASPPEAVPGATNQLEVWPVIEPTIKDLAYAEKSPAEKLDLYLPEKGSPPAPLVIWIHGGGFTAGDKHSMPRRDFGPPPPPKGAYGISQIQVPNVAALVATGYAVVSINYRLGTSFIDGLPRATQDGKAAVRFLRANAGKYNLDSNRFAVWGNSAGGYMASIIGVTGDQFTLFDDPSLGNASVSSAVQACVVWFGAEDRLPPELCIATYLPSAKKLPAFRIVNGDADKIISASQAQRLQDALTKAGAESTLTILPKAGHEDPAYMATQMAPTFAFLNSTIGRN
jgi:acetyl esterase/lipase